ncbi:tumor necrosis factor receptor superfamily member 10B-like isoform X2 [Arvicola amphibius]|uniref:tumor necrosis factor receptor superfamily member 10B-like isoform X2 n=1 Tax=Arvicola amphibius TaxID=1047088 RepID=UPI0018E3534F|nr:tumor necrosis factor receptor superfamily member 10B-like isoform X2 [Arvicola amphibius]
MVDYNDRFSYVEPSLHLWDEADLIMSVFGRVLADHQDVQQSPSEGKCLPGSYLSDEDGCVPCMDGIDYTSHANNLPSCIMCSTCTAGEDEIMRCNSTQDTKCQCKPGTFKDENSTELCQKCSKCTDEESEKASCTPNTNRKCVPKDSRSNLGLIIGPLMGLLLLLLLIILAVVFIWIPGARGRALQFVKRACPGREQQSENAVPLTEVRTSNPENDSPAMKASEEPEEAADSPTENELLVPANGINTVDGQPPAADGPHRQ